MDHFDPQDSLTDQDIDNLVEWGFNFVRLGVMWEAVETAPGNYNDVYLRQIDNLINRMGQKGIYTLVDAHQDVLARKICGEGMPNFYAKKILEKGKNFCIGPIADYFLAPLARMAGACKSMESYGYKLDDDGNPIISDCQSTSFFIYYTSPEALTLFRSIYDNTDGLQQAYFNYWEKVANFFS